MFSHRGAEKDKKFFSASLRLCARPKSIFDLEMELLLEIPIGLRLDHLGEKQQADNVGDGHHPVHQVGEVPDEFQFHHRPHDHHCDEDHPVGGNRAAPRQILDGLFS